MRKGSHATAETRAKLSASHEGLHPSEETRAKMSAAGKGRHVSEETRAKISVIHKGLRHTPEARAKMSAAHKGKALSEEHKAKMSAAGKGRHVSEETRAKTSAALKGNKNFLGHHHSAELRAEISNRMKANKHGLGHRLSDEALRRSLLKKQVVPTKEELELESILDKHFPGEWEFVGDGKVVIEGLCPDFININGKKAIIEHFGDYWHTKKGTSWRNTELGRVMAFNSYGFKCLVIWGHELKNEQNAVKKVEEFMKGIK